MQKIFSITLPLLLAAQVFAQTNADILTLADAEKIALQNHPRIAAADYRALAAQEVVKETRAGYFPTANLYADAVGADSEDARILAGGVNNPSIYDRAAGGLAVNQLITDFGRTANLTASSKFQAQAENQNANATREQVLLQVNINYFGTLGAQAVLCVAQQTLETRQLLLDQVSLLASNKLKSELDVSFARVAVQESKLLLQKAQNDADDAMTSLSTALGYREPRPFQLVEASPVILTGTNDVSQLVQTALEQRPELLSLQRTGRRAAIREIGTRCAVANHFGHWPDRRVAHS
jgi:outer membrane protein